MARKKKQKKIEVPKLDKKPTEKELNEFSESILLDRVSKVVFDPFAPMAIHWINWMFKENHKADEVSIEHGKTEYFDEKYKLIRSDVSFVITNKRTSKRTVYHIEVQTSKDGDMVIRMFNYGTAIAFDTPASEDGIIDFPQQVVIYLEENRTIGNSLAMKFRMRNGTLIDYEVPVIRNWMLDIEEIQANQIYPFLALQLNNHRKELKKAKNKDDKEEMQRLKRVIREDYERLMKLTQNLYQVYKLTDRDFTDIMNGIQYMVGHLNRVYLNDTQLEEEVTKMTMIYMDESKAEKVRKETAEKVRKETEEQGIKSSVELLAEVGLSKTEATEKVKNKYTLTSQQAQDYVNQYYPN